MAILGHLSVAGGTPGIVHEGMKHGEAEHGKIK